ncbi:ABC transporter ATP-binding protein [Pseudonocardia sp.]|uniref:ABC transporter ATP-binding protein n=1 Tax=Pseudonocardia sp. TaxID=60912 RepID=UPI00262EACF8|nr:ABC transporter ATP-binding protein [Pseudonocardia sp.]
MTDPAPGSSPVLSYRGVDVTYPGGGHAARGIDLDVAAGECLALVGESGCGKTTIARAAVGLLPPGTRVSGSIRVRGVEVVGAGPRTLRALRGRAIGYVGQDPYAACNPLHRVGGHVAEAWRALALRPPPGGVGSALAALGIADPAVTARRHPHEWSGGMLQRATIAAAAAHDPPVIVADEPTTALDADRADGVLAGLRATGAGVLLVSHDLLAVAGHADRVAVCYAGRVVETGPTADVLDRPRHPYTRALLAATPRPGAGLPEPLPGTPPPPTDTGPGCPFAQRCPEADADCHTLAPGLEDDLACHHR